jgi:hypothetical protein
MQQPDRHCEWSEAIRGSATLVGVAQLDGSAPLAKTGRAAASP